jgi:hypothetical protein
MTQSIQIHPSNEAGKVSHDWQSYSFGIEAMDFDNYNFRTETQK